MVRPVSRNAIVLLATLRMSASSWRMCPEEDGGGICPFFATCCPTQTQGRSVCISGKKRSPAHSRGECCSLIGEDSSYTGCPYGFDCAVNVTTPYCKLKSNHPTDMIHDTPRYSLCEIPQEMTELHGFPIHIAQPGNTMMIPYYSNMGDITKAMTMHKHVETVLVMLHGSGRNGDDYFCSGLSLVKHNTTQTLVISLMYPSPEDQPLVERSLVWADENDKFRPLHHSWRYGADAVNAPISSYGALDTIVGHFAKETVQFPKLDHLVVVGHSAGAQVAHRWALLSNIPAWNSLNIRAVVANPRSYCYLDHRRIQQDGELKPPDHEKVSLCPDYNTWQWGFDDGGGVRCPYRNRAINETATAGMVARYATRDVHYLSGQYDTLDQSDRCETYFFQGSNRQERASNYFVALTAFFGRTVHSLNYVTGSPHDHLLMYQSTEGRRAIFGGFGEPTRKDIS